MHRTATRFPHPARRRAPQPTRSETQSPLLAAPATALPTTRASLGVYSYGEWYLPTRVLRVSLYERGVSMTLEQTH